VIGFFFNEFSRNYCAGEARWPPRRRSSDRWELRKDRGQKIIVVCSSKTIYTHQDGRLGVIDHVSDFFMPVTHVEAHHRCAYLGSCIPNVEKLGPRGQDDGDAVLGPYAPSSEPAAAERICLVVQLLKVVFRPIVNDAVFSPDEFLLLETIRPEFSSFLLQQLNHPHFS
jgi:hypothetical protein